MPLSDLHPDLRLPLVQAPTGSVAGPELCAAVSAAGALGSMGLTWTEPEVAAAHVRMVRETTPNPFAVNFALAFSPNALDAALDAGAPVVTFSWGAPAPYLARCRSAGARVGIQVGNLAGARRMLDLGPDFLIVQGVEAGGHVQSTTPLNELFTSVIQIAPVPVVAAGGLADAEDVARVLGLGATAAMLGTRFVATRESRAHEAYKRALIEGDQTALTVCFSDGWSHAPHRVLRNSTFEAWEAAGCPAPGSRPGESATVGRTAGGEPIFRYEDVAPREGHSGEIEAMCLYAGTGVARIGDLPSASEVVARLVSPPNGPP